MARNLFLVVDVGKTNAKLVAADIATGRPVWSAERTNAVVEGPPYRALGSTASKAGGSGRSRRSPKSGAWTSTIHSRPIRCSARCWPPCARPRRSARASTSPARSAAPMC